MKNVLTILCLSLSLTTPAMAGVNDGSGGTRPTLQSFLGGDSTMPSPIGIGDVIHEDFSNTIVYHLGVRNSQIQFATAVRQNGGWDLTFYKAPVTVIDDNQELTKALKISDALKTWQPLKIK